MSYLRKVALVAGLALLFGSPAPIAASADPPPGNWVGTWGASATGTVPNLATGYADRTVRNVVHTSVGGAAVRVGLTNVLGTAPALLGAVTVAVAAGPSTPDAVPGTVRPLTFGGASSLTIPPGGEVQSDPVSLAVPEGGNLLVSVYTPQAGGPVTYHQVANQTSYVSAAGDHATEEAGGAYLEKITFWPYVSRVDVLSRASGTVVTLGDSITDGNNSTRDANHRWPDYLADRLIAQPGPTRLGVVNAGISSNRLLNNTWNPNALSRLDRDVLTVPGAKSVIVLLGINDIGGAPQHHEPSEIVAALRQISAQVRAKGLRILGGTLTPFGGSSNYTEELEGVRAAVNDFVRTSDAFDGVVDFDAAVRDPADPKRLRPEFDSGDHLHPKDAGYQAMAAAVRLDQLDGTSSHDHWVGTWQTAMAQPAPGTEQGLANNSIRNVVHTSVGGNAARVRLSNVYGTAPTLMGRVTLAVAAKPDAPDAVAGTMREVTFGGSPSITIPVGAEVLSDPVSLDVPADGNLLVTVFTPQPSGMVTSHPRSYQTSFLTPTGDHAAEEPGTAFTQTTGAWYYVTGVEVTNPSVRGAVIAFGDSITDGDHSTVSANLRWPDVLADRLAARPGPTRLSVLNSGISGNRILDSSALTGIGGANVFDRLDRDMLTSTGATTVIFLEGINDIGNLAHPDPVAITDAMRQIVARAHAQGLRVIGGTITPWEGWRAYNTERENVRQIVNSTIRGGAIFDAVIDFDKAVRDPANPRRLNPIYDSGDHLHPSDAGYHAMADAIDLSLLK
ncbi:SGNH/GDSL hydrolase family protein [Amycolatopsis taiwanensis]|uniref:SGNH hydrolase-type esterase domain-containing protein n=1 Tax=Amycolatopsis taiwanensis TaxID=342230 RepID=A0A9W6R8W9_9PSEU|nr:SGNH/GDSL hydrolase family protein [Amycolatopsis taiwanensis]GLY71204.1 hypothetical protein Atai01_78230 [Amycolatopsis taiwanensis]